MCIRDRTIRFTVALESWLPVKSRLSRFTSAAGSSATVNLIVNALATPALNANSNEAARLNRVYAAVMLVMGAPEYLVQK